MKEIVVVAIIATLILPIALADQANAQPGKQQLKVWMKVTNTKTGYEHTTEWAIGPYQFEEWTPIDVSNAKIGKMKSAFGTNAFTFTVQKRTAEGTWMHFKIEIGGTAAVGEVLSVRFV
jgi:hypothetical protein